ncbi:SusC/RagA family TonB-linked outer membrane protein [Maribacter sp. 2304DJ31-5]|uniref:SusC/RagA family TonB-linked outer membrane protein n=1 Tax=Maribacter sp. 2304DJ31-5 TaxID=3386273 RepID=UPI0039BC98E4
MKKNKPSKLFYLNRAKWSLKLTMLILFSFIFQTEVMSAKRYESNLWDLNQQESVITGTVTDQDGQPLPGANIIEKNTQNGTQTDFDGNFALQVTDQNATLVISYIGFATQEIALNGQTSISIALQEGNALDEVVVVGYGPQRRSDLSGSVASVAVEELKELPVTRVDQAIQGRVAGVQIQNNDGAPNGRATIRIRGANSINGGNDPLVVIDGFQGGSINTINPNDIESIQILKDASATAIYGSRGANGVVLVTTKKGKSGKPVVTYNSFYSLQEVRNELDLLNAGQYAQTVNAHRSEIGLNPVFTSAEISAFNANGGTDWQDEIFRTAFSQNHLLNVSGANDNISYYVSGNVIDQEGIIQNTSYDRYSLRANLTARINDKLSVTTNTYLSHEEDHPTNLNSFAGNNDGSPIFSAQVFAPTKPVFEEDGTYSQPGGGAGPPTNFNPLALAVEPIRENIITTTSINAKVDYEILDGLKFSVSGAYRLDDSEFSFYANSRPSNSPTTETASIRDRRTITLQNTNQLNYVKEFGKHSINLTGVLEQQFEEFNEHFTGNAMGFLTDAVTFNNLGLAAVPGRPSSERTTRSLLSYLGRVIYGYDNRYSLTLTARSDGSSVFGANNKRGFFPSAGLAWNISNESFLEDSKTIDNLKLRATYGETGNQAIDPYQSLTVLATTNFAIDGANPATGVLLAGSAGNPDLKWEVTKQTNIGIDLDMFNGRLNLVADYYKKNTEDLLLSVPLPRTSGVADVLRNIGEVENKGFEFYLGGTPVQSKNFSWNSGFNISFNDNEVLALSGEDEITLGAPGIPGFGNTLFLEVGKPIGQFRGFVQDGVWGTAEATEAAVFGVIPGAPRYVDQNNDDVIDDNDIVDIGNAQPDYTFGWTNTFSYKNLDLNVFVQGVQGNDILNIGRVRTERTSGDSDATGVAILNRWTPQNQNTNVPSFEGSNSFENLQSSRWIEDGSYVRIKNISLGYNIPQNVIEKIGLKSLKLYVTGTNLITFTDYTGYDPESSTNIDTRGGIDLASFPSQKTYTVGLDLSF